MTYTTFNKKIFNSLQEPMFFGENVNVARYDQQKHPIFEKLIDKQLSFFWRPEEVDITKDRSDYDGMEEHEQHIFLSNLKYQTLLDSVQGRSPNMAYLPIVSIPELETWIETWSANETIHSRSYTHIIRNIFPDPSVVFDDIVVNEEIVKRATTVSEDYDRLIEMGQWYSLLGEGEHKVNGKTISVSLKELKKLVYLSITSVNILEGMRFYVSFACSFAFAERTLMEGNAKIIKLIARDEALHLAGTQQMMKIFANGKDDYEMVKIAEECKDKVIEMYKFAAKQEKEWAEYLFKSGSMIGLNADILKDYVEYITNQRLKAINFEPIFENKGNPLPWMNSWLNSDNVQVAPQESEISSYLVGAINSEVSETDFNDFEL
ncbi:MAG: ribonucleotide-diphosphate reductase subunit beta [Epsilonproteobacteria bacterium]|nr:MAG: ribonucleotide-diphosphate reductase subunit beta [Campylobacterota bacterium]RLA65171.1 MAG: ribonucleotide-diphosphate reductase subunit beta [Campylobacterota bacterium]